jgi:hypothetical protein
MMFVYKYEEEGSIVFSSIEYSCKKKYIYLYI